MKPEGSPAKKVAIVGVFAAISYLVVIICKVIPNVASFLSFDAKDAVILVAGYVFGAVPAVLITVITSLLEFLTFSQSGIVGFIMNVFSTLSFCIPPVLIYRRRKSWNSAVIGLLVGVGFMTVSMLLWNYIVTPFYQGVPREVVAAMLPTVFLPFNLVKGGLNAGTALVFYKPIVSALRRAGLVKNTNPDGSVKFDYKLFAVGFAVFVVFIALLVLLIRKL